MVYYISSENTPARISFLEATLRGIAPDGKDYMPCEITPFPRAFFNNIHEMALKDIAYIVSNALVGHEIDAASLKSIIFQSMDADLPLSETDTDIFNMAVPGIRNISTKFFGKVLNHISATSGNDMPLLILSEITRHDAKDTASALASVDGAVSFLLSPARTLPKHIRDFIESVSPMVHLTEVHGSPAQCAHMLREALSDKTLNGSYHITTANSLNPAVMLARTSIFFHAIARISALRRQKGYVDSNAMGAGIVVAISPEISEAATALDMAIKAGAPINRIIYDDNPGEALRREIRPKELGLFLKICNDETVSEAMPQHSNADRISATFPALKRHMIKILNSNHNQKQIV
ncbi:MAG TPA: hypothetical protein PLT34_07445 [Muribaculaceae bacterium]|nr:hypothetical protein [Muribaculaceae bacterium]